jgi:hypothetical protein
MYKVEITNAFTGVSETHETINRATVETVGSIIVVKFKKKVVDERGGFAIENHVIKSRYITVDVINRE